MLYLEGSTDLVIFRAFTAQLEHPAKEVLNQPFVHYVSNQPRKAQDHFYGLREAKPDLLGLAIYDRLEVIVPDDPNLSQHAWRRCELESYLCQKETLLAFAEAQGRQQLGDLFAGSWRETMQAAIGEIEEALDALGKPSLWGRDLKVSDEFFDPLFKAFYRKLGLPNLMRKTDYHTLAPFVPPKDLVGEVAQLLDLLVELASRARPRQG